MSTKQEIGIFIHGKIKELVSESCYSGGKAAMSQLIKGLGKKPSECPNTFGYVLKNMSEEFYSKTGDETKEEWACYIALTLFALHQQGKNMDSECMNTDDEISLGDAMNILVSKQGDLNAMDRIQERFKSIATSVDIMALSVYLRAIIKLLKKENIKLNYALLAKNLYEFQFEESKPKVILRWGQDLYRFRKEEE